MARVDWVVRGVLVMITFGALGNGCCGGSTQEKVVVVPSTTSAGACTKDVDCKGSRVCHAGQCVER